jgi:hypothetical protein
MQFPICCFLVFRIPDDGQSPETQGSALYVSVIVRGCFSLWYLSFPVLNYRQQQKSVAIEFNLIESSVDFLESLCLILKQS